MTDINDINDINRKKQLDLEEIKKILLEILNHFKTFCEENDIKYFLSNGTLLGAVKYGGFIPWDDDIDVLMPREDYDRFLKIYRDIEKYKLFSSCRVSGYLFSFVKLCKVDTVKEENNIDSGVRLGLGIDVFPLDCCSGHIFKNIKRMKLYQIGCILSKFQEYGKRPFHKKLIIKYCRYKGYEFFEKNLISFVEKERRLGCEYKGCLVWPVYGVGEIIPADVFSDTVSVTFESETFPGPKGYDVYLRSLYGDYVQELPKEKQKTHHDYKAYLIIENKIENKK